MRYSVDGVSMEGGEAGKVHRQSRALLATMSVNWFLVGRWLVDSTVGSDSVE